MSKARLVRGLSVRKPFHTTALLRHPMPDSDAAPPGVNRANAASTRHSISGSQNQPPEPTGRSENLRAGARENPELYVRAYRICRLSRPYSELTSSPRSFSWLWPLLVAAFSTLFVSILLKSLVGIRCRLHTTVPIA